MQGDKGIGHIPVTTGLGIAVDNNDIGVGLGKQCIGKGIPTRPLPIIR